MLQLDEGNASALYFCGRMRVGNHQERFFCPPVCAAEEKADISLWIQLGLCTLDSIGPVADRAPELVLLRV